MKTITPIFKGEILNLDQIEVYYEDRDPNSSIFGVSGISNVLSKGNHSLFINPTENNIIDVITEKPLRLKESTSVKIEIIDRVGNRVYFDFPTQKPTIRNINGVQTLVNDYFAYGYRGPNYGQTGLATTFLIDNRLANGTGKLIMVGELEGVPNKWKGVYNVRWQRPITIQKGAINKSQLYFYKSPTATISEFVTPYFSQSMSDPTTTIIVSGTYSLETIKIIEERDPDPAPTDNGLPEDVQREKNERDKRYSNSQTNKGGDTSKDTSEDTPRDTPQEKPPI